MKKMGIRYLRQRHFFAIFFASVFIGSVAFWGTMNSFRHNALLGHLTGLVFGSNRYIACYPNFLLEATSEEFYEFHSGYGRNSVADVRLQFPDGSVYELKSVSEEFISQTGAKKTVLSRPGTTVPIMHYRSGFDSFSFHGNQIEGVSLTKTSNIKIDFGDGNFLELPIDRERLLKLLGDPDEWQASRTSLP